MKAMLKCPTEFHISTLTSKSAANMSSDSVNMSGAEGFFGLAPETNNNNKTARDGFLVVHYVVKQNIWNVFDSHTLQRSKHAAGGRHPGFGLQASN